MSNRYELNIEDFERVSDALLKASLNVEDTINDVLHGAGGQLIQDEIKLLMPVSHSRGWGGKKPHAKYSNSLRQKDLNLGVEIGTTKDYQYLYFPNDGSTTKNHAGNLQFFERAAENKTEEIINLCLLRATEAIDETINE